jgi:predicted nucleotidyltransferase
MDKNAVAAVMAFLSSALQKAGLRVEKLVLFGSQAKDCAREDSDLDVIVVSPDFRDKDIFQRVELTADVDRDTVRKFVVPVDLILMTPEEYESQTSPIAVCARESGAVYAP